MKVAVITISLVLIGLFYLSMKQFQPVFLGEAELEERAPTQRKAVPKPSFVEEAKSVRSVGDRVPSGAIENERLIAFASEKEMNDFLKKIKGADLTVLRESRRGRFLRVGFKTLRDLERFLSGNEQVGFNFSVPVEPVPDGQINPNAIGFGNSLHDWMRITGDNSQWGAGVSVFVIDTGISQHPIFENRVNSFSVVGDGLGTPNPHGDSMVSLWLSADGEIPAISPAVDLNSVRVADADGFINTASLTEAIYLAVEQGAEIITISLGSSGDSPFLETAVNFAAENGVAVVASAGNSGTSIPFYPAAYDGVISTTAIDAVGAYTGFGNTGESIDLAAPGVFLTALNAEGQITPSSTGTSPSSQVLGSVIAAVMSETGWDAVRSSNFVTEHAHDVGAVGEDTLFGGGAPRIGSLLQILNEDVYDAAVMIPQIVQDEDGSPAIILGIDNPGNQTLENVTLQVSVNEERFEVNLEDLPASESIGVRVPTTFEILPNQPLRIQTTANLPQSTPDTFPRDNTMTATISLRPTE